LLKLFRIIWELATGQLKSAQQLALELDMRYSTVWTWLHKVRSVVTVDSKRSIVSHCFLFERVLYRRSLESSAELPESGAEFPEASGEQAAGHERSDEQAIDFVCPNVSFSVEPLANEQNLLRVSGAACEFISGIFGGISRKYLQQYLAQYALFVRRKKSFIGMLRRCQRCAPMTRKTLRQFCSAEILMVPVLPELLQS
jgi:DNA-binding CsgD family transcriptional regulator